MRPLPSTPPHHHSPKVLKMAWMETVELLICGEGNLVPIYSHDGRVLNIFYTHRPTALCSITYDCTIALKLAVHSALNIDKYSERYLCGKNQSFFVLLGSLCLET